MKDAIIEISTRADRMPCFVTHPEQDGPFSPVILYMDVWGMREMLYDLARRVGTVGYYVIVPDLYYRQGTVRLDFRDAEGKSVSFHHLSPEKQKEVLALQSHLTDAMVVEDTADILAFLAGESVVKQGAVGSIGYCMGGRHVLQVAGRFPDRFIASASLHGTTLISDKPDSAHLQAKNFRGEMYCGFAEKDQFAPLSMVEELARLIAQSAVTYRYEVHGGAEHGYALPDRDVFHKQGAERDWEMIFAMFHRQIPPYAQADSR